MVAVSSLMILWFLSVSSIPARRRGGEPLGGVLSQVRTAVTAGGRTLRPYPGCLVCMGVDVDSGFPGSTYQQKRDEEVRAMLTTHLLSDLTSEEVDLVVAEELHLLDAAA
ncbi:hypothetical protein ACFYVR_24865 [Rhodococcus sp. NPDC003318]|uniref:hypothetical protein n=1 Tax=Rhodococcus sp. NPDC003318 TaxID=3364503 RepID=UPI00369AD6D6